MITVTNKDVGRVVQKRNGNPTLITEYKTGSTMPVKAGNNEYRDNGMIFDDDIRTDEDLVAWLSPQVITD